MKADDIRSSYLEFFRQRGHVLNEATDRAQQRPDAPVQQRGQWFSSSRITPAKVPVPYRRAATAQKCLRAGGKANDLDEVGKTARHMTFFEMMGNFSFGDYFKQEAILWAWEYSTEVVKIPAEKIWVSVYEDDDEAASIWEKEVGVPSGKIIRLGAKDNFWGPGRRHRGVRTCSELHLDRGEAFGPGPLGAEGDARFMEYWNLVFPQFDQHRMARARPSEPGHRHGHGAGSAWPPSFKEKETVFDVDHIFPIIQNAENLAAATYAQKPRAVSSDFRSHPRPVVYDCRWSLAGQRGPGLRRTPVAAACGTIRP